MTAVDPPWRDNRDAMEFPFLSLQKKRTKPIEFRGNGVHLSVGADSRFSIATIWDWDLVIFAASHLNDAIEDGRQPSPRVPSYPTTASGRSAGTPAARTTGNSPRPCAASTQTTVITNIRTDDEPARSGRFRWLTDYRIPKRYTRSHLTPAAPDGEPDPARPWEIELPPWLYNAILRQRDILAVHPDYFRLTGGLERWLYRLARKAVPEKADVPGDRLPDGDPPPAVRHDPRS